MIDQTELNRVREIHRRAEEWLAVIAAGTMYPFTGTFEVAPRVRWTEEQLLAWPERSARMRDLLRAHTGYLCIYWAGQPLLMCGAETHGVEFLHDGYGYWREMLDPLEIKDETVSHLMRRLTGAPDPYTGSDLTREAAIAERVRTVDDVTGNRKRLVAMLSAELDRPAVARFPEEGRSDRVTRYRRWGDK